MSDENPDIETELVDRLPLGQLPKGFWVDKLAGLRKHPGVWAKVRLVNTSRKIREGMAGSINSKMVSLPPGIWRAAVRQGELYVCFCGDRTQ